MKKVFRNSDALKSYQTKINSYEELNKLIMEILDYYYPPYNKIFKIKSKGMWKFDIQ
jgi:hypothetical protein